MALIEVTADTSSATFKMSGHSRGRRWPIPFGADYISETLRQLSYYGPLAAGWHLAEPITLEVERGEAGLFVVSEPTLDTYGAGQDINEAVADFGAMLIDLYTELERSEATLSQRLRELLSRLRTLIAPIS